MRIVLWGDGAGVGSYVEAEGSRHLAGIVAAEARPREISRVAALARSLGLPLLTQPPAADPRRGSDFLHALRRWSADAFVVSSYSMILDPDLLRLPPAGAFNVHASLLPRYRGANTLNWTLIRGEEESGVTIHRMTSVVDGGAIVAQRRLAVGFEDTAVHLREKLLRLTREMLPEFLSGLESGTLREIPQDETEARTWPRRRPQDGFFEWSWPPETIYNLIRALVSPWPGAWYLDGASRKVVLNSFVPFETVKAMRQRQLRERDESLRRDPPA